MDSQDPKPNSKPKRVNPNLFKKGQSGNPGGRPRNAVISALKKLTIDTYREVIEIALTGNIDDLKKIASDPTASAIQVAIAVAFLKAIKNGDFNVIEKIAERIVGKVPDQLNVVSNSTVTTQTREEKERQALEVYKKIKDDC